MAWRLPIMIKYF